MSSAPIWALGFRPFFLSAALFALFSVPVWIGHHAGLIQIATSGPAITGHMHEMVWGYLAAVIAGFAFTAVKNWTGLQTPGGVLLAGFVLLWIAGRILMMTGPTYMAAFVDCIFLPAIVFAVGRLIVRSGNTSNLFLVIILVLLSAINIVFHAGLLGCETTVAGWGDPSLALGLVTILVAVIAGRIIPSFTANATGTRSLTPPPAIEIVSLSILVLIFVMDATGMYGQTFAVVLMVAAMAHLARMFYWAPLSTCHEPLLWALPLAYLWLPISFILRSIAEWQGAGSIAFIHALSIGTLVGMTLAIMTRSSLGHTGRPLKADKIDMVIYASIHLAALFRVFAPMIHAEQTISYHMVATGFWITAFLAFLTKYGPILLRPRIDGKPG